MRNQPQNMGTCCPFKHNTVIVVIFLALSISFKAANSDPQTKFITHGCSQYNATDVRDFFNNLNSSFADIRNQISQGKKHFATTNHPVYTLFQCRDYLSNADCLSCYNTAVSEIRNCSAATGARVLFDGCFLRYESAVFYQETNPADGYGETCSSRNASQPTNFQTQAQAVLQDLQIATPRINGFFAASKRQLSSNNGKDAVYAIAQCIETASESGCQACLKVVYDNINGCLPKTDGRAYHAGCFMRYSATAFFADNQTINLNPYLKEGSSNKTKVIIGAAVGGGVGLVLLIILVSLLLYRRQPKKVHKGDILGATELQGPVVYSYKVLRSATKDFSEENKLGEGGFGEVYKGTLSNGSVVAVKRLSLSSDSIKAAFESEVRLISNVHHRNLVRLLGCADKGAELLLVYEYMANGSLDKYLYGEKRGLLNWSQRFNIIFGTARGLAYLHEQYHVCIIHRDIKSSNILLDDDFLPKIADFGLAKLMPDDRSHLSTAFAGTLGYTAPEYATKGHLTEKVDTYSFGIVALEIISGVRCNMKVDPDSSYLLEQASKLYEIDEHLKLVDETMDPKDYDPEEVKKVLEIAMVCTQSQPSERPTMSEVVVMLSSDQTIEKRRISSSGMIGIDRKFYRGTMSHETLSSNSNATVSFTDFTGR